MLVTSIKCFRNKKSHVLFQDPNGSCVFFGILKGQVSVSGV